MTTQSFRRASILGVCFALAAVSLRTGVQGPPHMAARRLVFQLVGSVRKGDRSPQADALAFARLSRASPDALRALARLIYRERSRGS